MSTDYILNCRRLPSRLNAEQVAVLTGCKPHDIQTLVRFKLLKPLGSPEPNATKWFSSSDIEAKMADEKWCAKVTDKLYQHWRDRKARRGT